MHRLAHPFVMILVVSFLKQKFSSDSQVWVNWLFLVHFSQRKQFRSCDVWFRTWLFVIGNGVKDVLFWVFGGLVVLVSFVVIWIVVKVEVGWVVTMIIVVFEGVVSVLVVVVRIVGVVVVWIIVVEVVVRVVVIVVDWIVVFKEVVRIVVVIVVWVVVVEVVARVAVVVVDWFVVVKRVVVELAVFIVVFDITVVNWVVVVLIFVGTTEGVEETDWANWVVSVGVVMLVVWFKSFWQLHDFKWPIVKITNMAFLTNKFIF